MAFKNQAEDEAYEKLAHLVRDFDYSLSQCEPIYAKAGKSRKRVVGHVMKDPNAPSESEGTFQAAYAEIVKTSNYQVAPYIKSQWVLGCRFVELCVPIEVRTEQDLMKIVNLTRKLLKRETTLENEFHNYLYTRADWCLDNLPLKLHS